MTYPFMPDPVPPGHGESQHSLDVAMDVVAQTPEYSVIVVLGDGKPEVEERFSDLGEALKYRKKAAQELRDAELGFFFVGILDESDVDRGWIESEDE